MEEYIDLVIDCIAILPPEITIHRLTGDGPRSLLITPLWSTDKKRVLNTLHRRLKERGVYQGCQREK
jgi:radical SAM superfamily enzyme